MSSAFPARLVLKRKTSRVAMPAPTRMTIGQFSRYSSSIQSLPASEHSKVSALARVVLHNHADGRQPVGLIQLIGHADKDTPRRPAFEERISPDRALAVRDALFAEIDRISRARSTTPPLPPYPTRIAWAVSGTGATQPLVPAPQSEPERARNRRVDVVLFPLGDRRSTTDALSAAAVRFAVAGQSAPSG